MKRVKRRYLALQVDSNERTSEKEFMDTVWGAVSKLFGEYGASLTGLSLIHYDAEKEEAIVRVNLAAVDILRTSLASITMIAKTEAAVHVMAISGSIKGLCHKLKT